MNKFIRIAAIVLSVLLLISVLILAVKGDYWHACQNLMFVMVAHVLIIDKKDEDD